MEIIYYIKFDVSTQFAGKLHAPTNHRNYVISGQEKRGVYFFYFKAFWNQNQL